LERFTGQALGDRPHIGVLFADKLGGFVVATPLLRGLRERYPGCIVDYFGGDRTAELEAACPYIDSRFSLLGKGLPLRRAAEYIAGREASHGPYDLVINLDFHPVNAALAATIDPRFVVGRAYTTDFRAEVPFADDPVDRLHREFWSAPDLLYRYRGVLESSYIGEIFCRIARIETDYHRTEVPTAPPGRPVPDVLIATGGTRKTKLWPTEHWEALIRALVGRGLSVGLLGSAPAIQRSHYGSADSDSYLLDRTPLQDLRGIFTLPQVAGALAEAQACVTIDNGIMHLAYSVDTATVAIFGSSPWKVWVPRRPNLAVVLPRVDCALCEENRFKNDACLRTDVENWCMQNVTPEQVSARLDGLMARAGSGD
jgi:heptosyltransferase III